MTTPVITLSLPRVLLVLGAFALLVAGAARLPEAEAQQPLLAPPECVCAKAARLDNASVAACTCGSMNCVSLVTAAGAGSALSCR
ncbi:MAG: hypothetical protein REI94_11115 [Moraxellaceae bacterium]|nr:hypothetical protein [Moraxellaceae bacterium]